jgi:CxxC motif-containing protein (DUF1111 family)
MRTSFTRCLLAACAAAIACAAALHAQTDPGPRTGRPQSGRPIPGLSPAEAQAFMAGAATFNEVETVSGGLGPRFNLDSCAGCHAQPAPGGSSPAVNPQIAAAVKNGAGNQVPPFLQPDGPVRVVRFQRAPGGGPDGGVHNLFVITGRTDAPAACQITQPDFSNTQNLSFRIPTPTFGLGLIEATADATLRANLAANSSRKGPLGIRGSFNTSANDGTITRYGWKAQNKSLTIFSGEAYNVEMGVTNELFPQEREDNPQCATNALPEDHPNPQTGQPSDVQAFATFMRFLAPPQPSPANPSITNGAALFDSTGCTLCHTPTLQSGNAVSPALTNQPVNLYSDLAIHRMGQALDDHITQGQALGDQWRTAPLWGLGDRLYLLHDGRAQDLDQAIRLHDSPGSEAHGVVIGYQSLTPSQKQDLFNFLRSL